MSAARKVAVRLGAWLLLAVPFVILGIAVIELGYRIARGRGFSIHTPCWKWQGIGVVSVYIPGCTTDIPHLGKPVEYRFNRAQLREDRAPWDVESGSVLVLGDSIVKGLFLEKSETIPSLLDARFSKDTGLVFINAGVRLTGPLRQALVIPQTARIYDARALMWFLNGSDTIDERLFTAVADQWDEDGIPIRFEDSNSISDRIPGLDRLFQLTAGKILFVESAIRNLAYLHRRVQIRDVPPSEKVLCGGIRRGARQARERDIPLMIVFTPHAKEAIERGWTGERYDPAHLDMMKRCAREEGALVIDLSEEPLRRERYTPDQMHMSAAGTAWVVERIAPVVRDKFLPLVQKGPRSEN